MTSTRKLLPASLSFYAGFKSKYHALNFEKYLKSLSSFTFRNKRRILTCYTHQVTNDTSWFVYILRCKGNKLYTGVTPNIEQRLKTHRSGRGSKFVRSHLPVKLVFVQRCDSKSIALQTEARIKQLNRADKLRLIASQDTQNTLLLH